MQDVLTESRAARLKPYSDKMASLRNRLPSELIMRLAGIIHEGICVPLQDDEATEDSDNECLLDDADIVRVLLDELDAEGLAYSPFFPMRKNDG